MEKKLDPRAFLSFDKLFCFFLIFAALPPLFAFPENTAYDPISVYLTWRKDPTTTMTVQWITKKEVQNNEVYFKKAGTNSWVIAVGASTPMPRKKPYLIHRAEITGLEPGTAYLFRPGGWYAKEYKFRTMPKNLDKPVRFVFGGDMYHDAVGYLAETNRQAAKADPLFALLGGDIAYASSKYPYDLKDDEAERWLQWLITWKKNMVTPEGFMIPFLAAIGNHDVNGYYDQPKKNAPFFYTLFAFPGEKGYNVLDFADYLSIISLDSGHTNPISGEQAYWLYQTLQERKDVPHTFAFYHVPAYPSVRKFKGERSKKIRENWVPIFEKFSLVAAFEHHDHAFKRTYPLSKNRIDSKGVLYFGDGAWGIKEARRPKKDRWYIAEAKRERHFHLVTLFGLNRYYKGIKPNGDILSFYEQVENPAPITLPNPIKPQDSFQNKDLEAVF